MSQKAQSSISTAQQSPKIITPNKELFGLKKSKPKKEVTNEKAKIQLGISVSHLTRQSVNFFQGNEKLYRNYTFYGKGEFGNSNSNVSFHPAIS